MSAGTRIGCVGGGKYPIDLLPCVANPFPPVLGDVGHRIGVNTSTIFKWFFRVRKWHVSATINWHYHQDGPPLIDEDGTTSGSFDFEWAILEDIEDPESDFVQLDEYDLPAFPFTHVIRGDNDYGFVPGRYAYAGFNDDPIDYYNCIIDNISPAPLEGFFTIEFGFGASCSIEGPKPVSDILFFDSGLFYPWLTVIFQASGAHANGAAISTYQGGANTSTEVGVWSIDGQSDVSLYGTEESVGAIYVTTTGGSINITPKKYWPYANSQGQQVYDEDTGAQLVDPFS